MKNTLSRIAPLFLLLTMWLAACTGGGPARVWLKSPGWSRGVAVGQTELASPAAMAFDSAGHLFVFLVGQSPGKSSLVRLDPMDGAIGEPIGLDDLDAKRVVSPRMVAVGSDLWLFWIDGDRLQMVAVNPDNEAVGPSSTVSGSRPVADFSLAQVGRAEPTVWFSGGVDAPGVYQASLNGAEPKRITAEGVRPWIVLDQNGDLHATWIVLPESQGLAPIHYASYPQGGLENGQEWILAEPSLTPTDGLQGPLLGLTQDRAMVFYVITLRTGLEAGKIKPFYFSYPLDDPSQVTAPTTFEVPGAADLKYDLAPSDGLKVGERASPQITGPPGQHVSQISIPSRVLPEMAVALRARIEFRMNQEQTQVGLIFLDGSGPVGYQQLTFTPAGSSQPSLLVDSEDYGYLTWLEPAEGSGYTTFLSSTRPSLVEAFRGVTGQDVSQMVSESVFGMLSGIVLVPLALVWMIAPLLVIVVSSFWRSGDDRLSSASTWIPLALAIAVYWLAKRAFLPQVFSYVPFSAWVPIIGPAVGAVLRIGLPILGTALALWVAYSYTYRRDRTSPTFFVLIFSAVDAMITMALYGGLFLGF
ncbi:MAG: hypothetical protein WBR18_02090 [Anaerolineales bacterium]